MEKLSNVARFAANSGCRHGEPLNVAVLSLETACLQYETCFSNPQDVGQLINFDVRLIKLAKDFFQSFPRVSRLI